MSDFRPIRLAMIGLGRVARDQHLPAIASDSRFELVATVDPAGGLPDVPGFPSFEQMLKAGASIDAVTIATPPQVRESVARCALAAGLHVFPEKPPASTVLGAMKLADAASLGVTGSSIGARSTITLDLDFREEGAPCWEIDLHTVDGGMLRLSAGGHRLVLDGVAVPAGIEAEYPRLYARFAGLIARGASDVDLAPLQLVADAFAVARISRCARYAP